LKIDARTELQDQGLFFFFFFVCFFFRNIRRIATSWPPWASCQDSKDGTTWGSRDDGAANSASLSPCGRGCEGPRARDGRGHLPHEWTKRPPPPCSQELISATLSREGRGYGARLRLPKPRRCRSGGRAVAVEQLIRAQARFARATGALSNVKCRRQVPVGAGHRRLPVLRCRLVIDVDGGHTRSHVEMPAALRGSPRTISACCWGGIEEHGGRGDCADFCLLVFVCFWLGWEFGFVVFWLGGLGHVALATGGSSRTCCPAGAASRPLSRGAR